MFTLEAYFDSLPSVLRRGLRDASTGLPQPWQQLQRERQPGGYQEDSYPLNEGAPTFLASRPTADYILDDRMAKTPANVYNLLKQVWTPTLAVY